MKINCNLNFGRKFLYRAKLEQPLQIMPLCIKKDVFISELEPQDKDNMNKIRKLWKETTYGESIIEDFEYTLGKRNLINPLLYDKFFIVEDKRKKVKAMAVAEIKEGYIELALIQSEREKKGKHSIKGAGSCLLYAVSKLAQSLNMNCVHIGSLPEASLFYTKAGAKKLGLKGTDFVIDNDDFDKFQKKLEDKYSIKNV